MFDNKSENRTIALLFPPPSNITNHYTRIDIWIRFAKSEYVFTLQATYYIFYCSNNSIGI